MGSRISHKRFWSLNLTVALFFVIILYQLLQLAVIRQNALLSMADRQHQLTVETPPLRGQILDSQGRELATNLKVPSIYAVPKIIRKQDRDSWAAKVSPLLGLSETFTKERLNREKSFVWLKRKVSPEAEMKIKKLETPAFGIVEEYRRYYPQGDLLSHVLGFTNIDSEGLEGLEMTLNRELEGRPGRRQTKRDALGREIKAFEVKMIPALDGHRVHLTVDQQLQYLTERALEKAFKDWKAKGAWAILMEAKTGKILAMANRPTFNGNQYETSPADLRRNRALTDMFEPGSIFKIVAAAAALNEGKVTPESKIDCENGDYRYGSKVLHDVHPYGLLSFEDVISKSSNIGTVKAAAKLAPEVFHAYIEAFGFGRLSGIDLPGEVPGYTRPPKEWSKTSPYNIPIGQEVLVTALQMTNAMAIIANGGSLMRPYVVSKIEDQAGVTLRRQHPKIIRSGIIRPEIAAIIRRILVKAVHEGTGKKAKIPGISVGGKTGTAQKTLPGGGYSHSNFVSSFIGFAPAEDPLLVMTVGVDDPKPLYYGGTVAAPVFKEVVEAALYTLGYVPPESMPVDAALKKTVRNLQANSPKLQPAEVLGKGL
ncbi:MAG: penicillin-binding protein 2 [Candidatus Omnitrophica bacterium]|nr:penicillin-binding protein 2 [Candidatus Omnitrophota bacterium]